VRTGAELAWDDVPLLDDADLDLIAQGPPDRRWLLYEAPLYGAGGLDDFLDAAHELRARGFALLIGHPERSPELMAAPAAIDELLRAGDRLQVNGSSLIGYHGPRTRARGRELVRSGRVSVIASDAHQLARGPVLDAAVAELVEDGLERDAAERLASSAPRELLEA
jgi:tyrosine-protein phosphatase YwqE